MPIDFSTRETGAEKQGCDTAVGTWYEIEKQGCDTAVGTWYEILSN